MNLFRSEEDARNWSEFAPGTEQLRQYGEAQGEAGKHPRGATEWYWREVAAGRAENSR